MNRIFRAIVATVLLLAHGPAMAIPQGTPAVPQGFVQAVGNNTALSALSTATVSKVVRFGHDTMGDGPFVSFVAGTSPCSLGNGAGDGGLQVPSADGKCWIGQPPSEGADIRIWGVSPPNGSGVMEATAAVQGAANNPNVYSILIPDSGPNSFGVCGVVLPHARAGLRVHGVGNPSKITQGACGKPIFSWGQDAVLYTGQQIGNLWLDGTVGTNHTIDTRGIGGLTMSHLYFNNVPVNYSSILIDGAAGTYMHDDHLDHIDIYSGTAGHSGVRFGALASDSDISHYTMQGSFVVKYGEFFDAGSATITTSESHPYNAAINVVGGTGCVFCKWVGGTLDNALSDIVDLIGFYDASFNGTTIEAIPQGKCGVRMEGGTSRTSGRGIIFIAAPVVTGPATALAACESGATANNVFVGGSLSDPTTMAAVPFLLTGSGSYAQGFPSFNPLGTRFSFSSAATSAQAQGTTTYLGANGANYSVSATEYVTPSNGTALSAYIAVDTTPASGQSFNFTVYRNQTVIGTGSIAPGSYAVTITLNAPVFINDAVYIKSTFTAASGSATPRWVVSFSG